MASNKKGTFSEADIEGFNNIVDLFSDATVKAVEGITDLISGVTSLPLLYGNDMLESQSKYFDEILEELTVYQRHIRRIARILLEEGSLLPVPIHEDSEHVEYASWRALYERIPKEVFEKALKRYHGHPAYKLLGTKVR